MDEISPKEQKILRLFLKKSELRSSEAHRELFNSGDKVSLVTVKRTLTEMADKGLLTQMGAGRSTSYAISANGRIFADVDARAYVEIEPDKRYGLQKYNFELFKSLSKEMLTDDELRKLEAASSEYRKRIIGLSETVRKKELERLVIELSWKSSKIEGNTYTLLDTERLILENKEAPGHAKQEAQMILNHKDAFGYIRQNADRFKAITRKNLEELHAILIKGLGVSSGFRSKPVGVTGSIYRPLDNVYQIAEAVDDLASATVRMKTPYDKALLSLLGIAYIQPFEDGNKRTSRLMANALLIAHGLAPLSYRSVDEEEYRAAMMTFYELNSSVPIKKIFVSQYEFAAGNYAVN
jgi:Fic family protein